MTHDLDTTTSRTRRTIWLNMMVFFMLLSIFGFYTYSFLNGYGQMVVYSSDVGLEDRIFGLFSNQTLRGSEEDRINVLLLGIRGKDDPHGGLLADSIMVLSIKPSTKEAAMISIPRDLYVEVPDLENSTHKINAVNLQGEKWGENKGMEFTKNTLEVVLDIPIHYTYRVNIDAFKEVVAAVGGVDIYLENEFYEPNQLGVPFYIPAGQNHLNANDAFMYCQARFSTSDFDRQRRQQEVLTALKDKVFDLGFITNTNKLSDLTQAVGENVKTDMNSPWEIKQMVEIIKELESDNIRQITFSNREGYLESSFVGASYVLQPTNNDYSRIQNEVRNIFDDGNTN